MATSQERLEKLEVLYQRISLCTRCELRESATAPVSGIGDVDCDYFIIGEAPGKDEDKFGAPFVGKAGRRLDKLMALAGMSKNDCYLSNVCRCRPPENRTPKKKEINACQDYLWEEIKLVQPKNIITLGATPLSLFSEDKLKTMHGCMFEYEFAELA